MTIHYVTIKGRIKNGKLDAELPNNVIDGEAILKIPVGNNQPENQIDAFNGVLQPARTLHDLMAAGVIGSGENEMKHIGDSAEWVEVMRKKEEEQRAEWKH